MPTLADIANIKARHNIVDAVSAHVALEPLGRSYRGCCPFHAETTPTFYVFPERQYWRCFGSCATGGDIVNFTMRAEGLGFAEALRQLADRVGMQFLG